MTSMNGHFKPHCIALHCITLLKTNTLLDTAIYATTVEMIGKLNHTDHTDLNEEELENVNEIVSMNEAIML